jgi:radical SAM protein with 4Fe4S-binding SPASM domain
MLIAPDLQIYVKTTETCNLNCAHCFTSGSLGKKIFFDPRKTAGFIAQLVDQYDISSLRLVFHGGEPMLAPLPDLRLFHDLTSQLPCRVSYGLQTNLVYKLTPEKLSFLDEVLLEHGFGTSWDADIRFNEASLKLWESNVRALVGRGHRPTLMVGLTRNLIERFEPRDVIRHAIDLGFPYLLFERITEDGNARAHPELFPDNRVLDAWLLRMYQQTNEEGFAARIENLFLNELLESHQKRLHVANRCRECEQRLITINADGSLSGCPNSAAARKWGTLADGPEVFVRSAGRVGAICSEKTRNAACFSCEVRHLCNGDCYKLPWQGDQCAAPKSIFKALAGLPS